MIFSRLRAVSSLFLCLLAAPLAAATPPLHGAAIATAHPLATEAGFEVLAAGGNAFDAAVAISATLAVVEPMGSGLGGGGFWLLHRASDGKQVMIDGREMAPGKATADMYLDKTGKPRDRASLDGPLAAGIPGLPAALDHLATRYGRLPLSRTLAPAIRHARNGFTVYERYRLLAGFRIKAMQGSDSARVFLPGGKVPDNDVVIRQPDLARTLQRLADAGRKGFYQGKVARKLVRGVRRAGGIWTLGDLSGYRIKERAPVTVSYHGMRLTTASLPSSAGVVLSETLNILEGLPLAKVDRVERRRYVIEAMRRAYHDRARYLGDADFIQVDVKRLSSKPYAAQRRKTIGKQATPSASLEQAGSVVRPRGSDTTHFSVIDAEGNRVAATLSINYPFGSGFMPRGTGVVLNNEMDDFVIKPGVPNVYGLVGNRANGIEPGKRPLSSMSPTFLETRDRLAVLGTPGGSRILSMVLLAALEFAEGRGGPAEWVSLPRYHHQYLPDVVTYEEGAFDALERDTLEEKGYRFSMRNQPYGNMQAVMLDKRKGKLSAASDPRNEGSAEVR